MAILRKVVLGLTIIVIVVLAIIFGWRMYRYWTRPDIARDGGTILVYEIDESRWPGGKKPDDYSAENLAARLKQRIDPDDVYNVTVRPVSDSRVEIILPRHGGDHARQVQDVKELISRVGSLKFVILANTGDDKEAIKAAKTYFGDVSSDPKKQEALKLAALTGQPPPPPRPPDGKFFHTPLGDYNYVWVELGRNQRIQVHLDNASKNDASPVLDRNGQPTGLLHNALWQELAKAREKQEALVWSGLLYFSRAVANADRLPEADRGKKYEYFLLSRDPGLDEQGRPVPPLTGEYLISVSRENDDQRGIVVRFQFNSEGGRLLSDLTTKNAGGQMAIVLDDQVQSAPNVLDPITGGGGIIHGNYTAEEVDRMVTMLRSGALPATLKPMPVSEVTVEPRK